MKQIAIKTPNGYYGLLVKGNCYNMLCPPDADGNYRIPGIARHYVNVLRNTNNVNGITFTLIGTL